MMAVVRDSSGGGDGDDELLRMAFRVLDKDGSGTITTKEFRHLMTNIGDKLSSLEVRKINKLIMPLKTYNFSASVNPLYSNETILFRLRT